MNRLLPFKEEHNMFRKSFAAFLDKEVVPYYEEWEKNGAVPHEIFKKFGNQGYLGIWMDEKYGGADGDLLYSMVETEEMSVRGLNSLYTRLSSDVVAPYIYNHGSEELKQRYLPGDCSGDIVLAVAMSEPNAGSDLAHLETKAVKEGDYYVLNGSKAFISNGMIADAIVVAVRTDTTAKPAQGISLILIDTNTPGFTRTRVRKMGMHAQDTAELAFVDCRVPAGNLIGEENKGFYYLMEKLERERLMAAHNAVNQAKYSLSLALKYVKERHLFGTTVSKFQNTQFELAKIATEIEVAQSFVEHLVIEHMQEKRLNKEVSMAKYYCCELAFRVASHCLQFFGGYGVCEEYPISRQFMDARFLSILGGTSEIQLAIVARELGL